MSTMTLPLRKRTHPLAATMARSEKRANSLRRQNQRLPLFGHGPPKRQDEPSRIKRLRYDRQQNLEEQPNETRVFQ
jgi:hypothetical protein